MTLIHSNCGGELEADPTYTRTAVSLGNARYKDDKVTVMTGVRCSRCHLCIGVLPDVEPERSGQLCLVQ